MHNNRIIWLLACLALISLLAGCGGERHPAERAVEMYLQALVDKEEAAMVTRTCGDFELDALLEYDAFSAVKTQLEDLSCQLVSQEGDTARVTCQGAIIATYGSEDQHFELDERTYKVVKQGGDWLVCGY